MVRLEGASEVIREAVPPELVPVFWAITALGSTRILMVGLSLAYWNWESRREELLTVIGAAFVAYALTLALKHGFAMPRPPAAIQRYPIEPSPVGFPSGHAIAATVIYGGALVATEAYRDYRKTAGVGVLVALIGLSRVVLGVHYLGDVLVGFVVGLVAVGALWALLSYGTHYAFAAAAVLSIPAVVVTGAGPDSALALGGSVGGLAATLAVEFDRPIGSPTAKALLSVAGLLFIAGALAVEELVESVFLAALAVNLVLAAGIIGFPATVPLVERALGRDAPN